MRRLEYTRRVRSSAGRARHPTEAMLVLAHVARERLRLQQERSSLEKRIQRIEARLGEIAGTESRLVPVVQLGLQQVVANGSAPVPGSAAEITLRY